MCNASNHRVNCTCGFGGDGHLGRRSTSFVAVNEGCPNFEAVVLGRSFESFVNPNANCPVCGKSVFYYRSPNGGSVYFDELGPPWSKHPCTDQSRTSLRQRAGEPKEPCSGMRFTWHQEGWIPFILSNVTRHDSKFIEVRGRLATGRITLYLYMPIGHLANLSGACIAHLRPLADDSYEISYVNEFGLSDKRSASTSLHCAYDGQGSTGHGQNRDKRRR